MIEPQREMTFAEVRLQSQRIERFHLCLLLPWLCRLIEMVNITDRGREPRVRESEVRIEFDRLLVKIYRRLEILQQVVRSRLILPDRKSTRLNSSHRCISYAVFCLK